MSRRSAVVGAVLAWRDHCQREFRALSLVDKRGSDLWLARVEAASAMLDWLANSDEDYSG